MRRFLKRGWSRCTFQRLLPALDDVLMTFSLEERMSQIAWRQDSVAGVPLNRYVGYVGPVEVGSVQYDGSNRFWVWASPLQEDAWGYGPTEGAAKTAMELWLRSWLDNFRPFFKPET
jgi:hypothetical protein